MVQLLLENGADPRLTALDCCTPAQCTASRDVADLLGGWDLDATNKWLRKLAARREDREQVQKQRVRAEIDSYAFFSTHSGIVVHSV